MTPELKWCPVGMRLFLIWPIVVYHLSQMIPLCDHPRWTTRLSTGQRTQFCCLWSGWGTNWVFDHMIIYFWSFEPIYTTLDPLRPIRNGSQYVDSIKLIFLDENFCIFVPILLKFVLDDIIYTKPALAQTMAMCLTADNKPLSEPIMVSFTGACMQGVWKFFSASAQNMKPKIFLSFIHSFQNFGFSAPRSARSIFRHPAYMHHSASMS